MAPTGYLAGNPGICPDWESNQRPFGSQAGTQSTEPRQPGLSTVIFKFGLIKPMSGKSITWFCFFPFSAGHFMSSCLLVCLVIFGCEPHIMWERLFVVIKVLRDVILV